jgi:hypothetical protein
VGKIGADMEANMPQFIAMDENKEPSQGGFIEGNGSDETDKALAKRLFPRPGMNKHSILLKVAAMGGTVKMCGVEWSLCNKRASLRLKVREGARGSVCLEE